ncbi:MAG: nucleotidyltransferase domain-containing protein [Candidatus Shapirobacteria bacterium]|nr:nucleotidyltransferase domain-containing protein [Candidatus Shapirobacteria bacterium]
MNKIIPEYIDKVLRNIIDISKPISVFLYGSRVRNDFESDSDYEIGIIYKESKKWSRQQLKELNSYENVKIYPFSLEELESGEIDTPFPKAIYLKTISEESVCLYGEKLENIISPIKIDKDDLFEATGFCLGRAYSAVVSSKQNDLVATRDGFTKSGLYGIQLLIFVKTGNFVTSYKEMENKYLNLIPDEFKDLVKHIFDVRKNVATVAIPYLYKNISFLNKVVLKTIKDF